MNYFEFVEEMDKDGGKFLSTEHEMENGCIRFVDHYDMGNGRGVSVIVERNPEKVGGEVTAAEYFDMEDYGG